MSGWAYMLRCSDGSYYVGSTSHEDIGTRVGEHNEGKFGGYTSKRRPVVLLWAEQCGDLRDAHVVERRIKGWGRAKKEALIKRDWATIQLLAKRPSARRPSRLAALAPQGDALLMEQRSSRAASPSICHPEMASKDDGGEPRS